MRYRPLLRAFAAVLCGEVMAYLFPGRWSAVLLAAAAAAGACFAGEEFALRRYGAAKKVIPERQRKNRLLLSLFFAAIVLLGAGRMMRALDPDGLSEAAEAAGRGGLILETNGTVRDIRAASEGGWKVVIAGLEDTEISGESAAVIYTDRLPGAEPGDRVRVSGTFHAFTHATNPGQFDQYRYNRAEGLSAWSSDAEITLRERAIRPVTKALFRLRVRLLSAAEAMAQTPTFMPLHGAGGTDADLIGQDRDAAAAHWRDSCGILVGMFLGERALIPSEVRGGFSAAGIAHMLAISGLHISLVGMRLFRFLKKKAGLDYPRSAAAAAGAVLLYCMLTGFTASSVRALVMFAAMAFGEASSRPYDMASAMSLAGLVLCLASPLQITQAGFQLSFLSAAAIAAAVPAAERFTQVSVRGRAPLFGVCLQTVTLPAVTAHYFRVPAAGLFLNPVMVPALPAAAGASFAALAAAVFSARVGCLIFVPVHLLFESLRLVCGAVGAVPFLRFLTGQPSLPKLAVCCGATAAAVTAAARIAERDAEKAAAEAERERRTNRTGDSARPGLTVRPELGRRQKRRRFLCVIALFLTLTALLSRQAGPASGILTVTFLDVGQGDGIFLEFPSGATALIDCGSSDAGAVGTYRLEPFLDSMAVERPDMVFLTHLDEDHVSGIRELAADGRAPWIFLSSAFSAEKREEKETFVTELRAQGVEVTMLSAGDVWTDRSGARLTCVYPRPEHAAGSSDTFGTECEEENDTSLVLLLEYGEFSVLFTGDIGAERETEILERLRIEGFPAGTESAEAGGHVLDVLKVAHHGSAYSTGAEFLDAVRPELAVVSCGAENRYGHPAEETLARLDAVGARTVVTAEVGCVIVTADESGILDVQAPYRRSGYG